MEVGRAYPSSTRDINCQISSRLKPKGLRKQGRPVLTWRLEGNARRRKNMERSQSSSDESNLLENFCRDPILVLRSICIILKKVLFQIMYTVFYANDIFLHNSRGENCVIKSNAHFVIKKALNNNYGRNKIKSSRKVKIHFEWQPVWFQKLRHFIDK